MTLKNPRVQQGTALVSVMLILAIVAFITATMAENQALDIRRLGNILAKDQASMYTYAAEDLAFAVLKEDYDRDQKDKRLVDHLDEEWHGQKFFPVEGGGITASLEDLQGRFNLNWLKDTEGHPTATNQLLSLMQQLGIPSSPEAEVQTIDIVNGIKDWLDEDDLPTGQGAEDYYYQGLETPYRVANNAFVSVTELRLIKGLEDEDFVKLEPFIVVLPETSKLNINTAPKEVIDSIFNGLDTAKIIEGRGDEGYDTVQAAFSGQAKKKIPENADNLYSVRSNYYLLDATARVSQRTSKLSSVLFRPDEIDKENKFKVVLRDKSKRFNVIKEKEDSV